MKLCIAEKPSVAKDLAEILGAKIRHDGYFEGNDYCVTWTFGHLCSLKDPEDYNPLWKYWKLEDLPIIPAQFGIKIKGILHVGAHICEERQMYHEWGVVDQNIV